MGGNVGKEDMVGISVDKVEPDASGRGQAPGSCSDSAAEASSGVVSAASSPKASSPKKVLKTALCCHAWMKNSCWAGSLMALISRFPSGCLR